MPRKNALTTDRDNWQRDAERLRIVNAKLLAALEAVQRDFGRRELTAETVTHVHAAIEAAEQS